MNVVKFNCFRETGTILWFSTVVDSLFSLLYKVKVTWKKRQGGGK